MAADAPLFARPEHETLSQKCQRIAEEIAEFERSPTRTVIDLTEARQVLTEAANELEQPEAT